MKNKKIIKILIVIICIVGIVSLIVWKNLNKTNNIDENKTKIVTSFYPMYIIAENITKGVENVELKNMANVNVGCLHDYTITTDDMKKIENADIFIMNGLGIENFIDKMVSANQNVKVIDSSVNIQNLISDEKETNAHIWTSIEKYINQVKNIKEGLEVYNPENSQIYEKNANQYIKSLEQLREKYLSRLENLKEKKAICLNEAFEYMGQELGMKMITIENEHEESSISAETLRNVIDTAKKEKIEIIIIDKNDNKSNAETIAKETGAKIYELNSGLTGNIDENAYINAMEENLNLIEK